LKNLLIDIDKLFKVFENTDNNKYIEKILQIIREIEII